MIITDHHENLAQLPTAVAIINPHTSPDYPFKGICGAAVAFKLINAMMSHKKRDKVQKTIVFEYYLPIIALATVADCVPLVHENRSMVKK
jgi:single-stranded-DNA-specific exonuclease